MHVLSSGVSRPPVCSTPNHFYRVHLYGAKLSLQISSHNIYMIACSFSLTTSPWSTHVSRRPANRKVAQTSSLATSCLILAAIKCSSLCPRVQWMHLLDPLLGSYLSACSMIATQKSGPSGPVVVRINSFHPRQGTTKIMRWAYAGSCLWFDQIDGSDCHFRDVQKTSSVSNAAHTPLAMVEHRHQNTAHLSRTPTGARQRHPRKPFLPV